MNPISNLSIMVVPRWVRALVISILSVLVLIYFATAVVGIIDDNRPGWIEARTYILGILLPFLLVSLLLGFNESGVNALVARSARFLNETIPALTVGLCEPTRHFRTSTVRGSFEKVPIPNIRIQSAANMAIANYLVEVAPQGIDESFEVCNLRKLAFRIELNATKANINILIQKDLLQTGSKMCDPVMLFPGSFVGAKYEGYWFNEHMVERRLADTDYLAIVAVKRLPEEFLTNPVLQLDFGQDLILMLRSMLAENPALFAKVCDPA